MQHDQPQDRLILHYSDCNVNINVYYFGYIWKVIQKWKLILGSQGFHLSGNNFVARLKIFSQKQTTFLPWKSCWSDRYMHTLPPNIQSTTLLGLHFTTLLWAFSSELPSYHYSEQTLSPIAASHCCCTAELQQDLQPYFT